MDKNCVIFVIKKMYLAKLFDFVCTWILNFLIFWTIFGLQFFGLFGNSGLDLDRKI